MSPSSPCPTEPILRDFVTGSLPAPRAEAVQRHLSECELCQQRIALLRQALESSTVPGQLGVLPGTGDHATPGAGATVAATPPGGTPEGLELGYLLPSDNPQALGRLGNHDVLCLLGHGGMGVVFKAFDQVLHRTVAIKVLSTQLATSEKARRRFLREARAVAAVNHPNVVTLHAVDEQGGMPYLVMEYVPGRTLRDRIKTGPPFDLASLLRIGAQTAAGLAAAHQHGVIHRDIKPGNILLEDGIERVKISDFGLALVALDVSEISSAERVVGTPAYMSPEQVSGGEVGPLSDLFSLGCVLYAMVAGKSPFHGTNTLQVARYITDLTPPPLRQIAPQVPPFLSDLVTRLLAKPPEERYQSAEEVRQILQQHLARLHQEPTDSAVGFRPIAQAPRPPRRLGKGLAAAALVLVLLVGGWPIGRGLLDRFGVQEGAEAGATAPQGVLTVAQSGDARFRTIREALAQAQPGSVIRILDAETYPEVLALVEPARLQDVILESPLHAVLESPDPTQPLLTVEDIPGLVVRGLHLRTHQRQHGLSVRGTCAGLTVDGVRFTQPATARHAAVVLWHGARGTEARPIKLENLEIDCGEVGLAVLGAADQPAAWVRVEGCRFRGPGVHLTLEKSVEQVTVCGNVFVDGLAGIGLGVAQPGRANHVTIANNTFFGTAAWLSLQSCSLEQGDVAITRNLIVQAKSIKLRDQDLAAVAARWFRQNWWEPAPDADLEQVRLVAERTDPVPLLSRDPASPDFLRPAATAMAASDPIGAVPPPQPIPPPARPPEAP